MHLIYNWRPDELAMPDPDSLSFGEKVVAAVLSTAAAAAGGLRWFKAWRGTQRDVERTSAEIDIIAGLRGELERLSKQNGVLAEALNELQREVIDLRAENGQLRLTIDRLNAQLAALHGLTHPPAGQ